MVVYCHIGKSTRTGPKRQAIASMQWPDARFWLIRPPSSVVYITSSYYRQTSLLMVRHVDMAQLAIWVLCNHDLDNRINFLASGSKSAACWLLGLLRRQPHGGFSDTNRYTYSACRRQTSLCILEYTAYVYILYRYYSAMFDCQTQIVRSCCTNDCSRVQCLRDVEWIVGLPGRSLDAPLARTRQMTNHAWLSSATT